jgi:hypothetical protein
MSKSATRLLTLAIYATALVVVPLITPAKAATISSEEEKAKKKIQTSPGFSDPRSAAGQAGALCSRGIDCGKWPPPIYDDPDRKGGGGGGGM